MLALSVTIAAHRLHRAGREAIALKLDRWARAVLPALTLVGVLAAAAHTPPRRARLQIP
ncbi:MAG TPA: hypothetical protein VGQ83_14865 [Polyangia bacterium]|jgi:hypothetical protein